MPRYIIYARKSTESEDRQALSIDSQIRELQDYARAQSLEIVSVDSEARSARAPGRKVFGEVLTQLTRGAADGVLCWKLDRLARNPVDGGALIWAIDEGRLKDIVTPQRTFGNTGNDKFWMQLEFGMAKKYVDDLSDNVRRGNRAKLELGWLPGVPPLGYLNDRVDRTIVPDPDRFPLVRRMWDLVLRGTSPVSVLEIANNEWGFRTRKSRRQGGRPLGRSTIYKLLSDPFYYGLLSRAGESYPGAHKPMITKDEFDRVQELLGRPNRTHHQKHQFALTGLIRCGGCGLMVTAEEQVNRYGTHYTYYHCTKRRREHHCTQGFIRVERLEEQIRAILSRIQIADDFRDWALKHLRQNHDDESSARQATDKSLDAAYRNTQKQIDRLIQLRLRGLVTDQEFGARKQQLVAEQVRLKARLVDANSRATRWFELCERAIAFANEAVKRFEHGTLGDKREILVALGSNFQLKDGILRTQLKKPFLIIEEGSRNSSWWGLVDGIKIFFEQHPDSIQWPAFCKDRPSLQASKALSV